MRLLSILLLMCLSLSTLFSQSIEDQINTLEADLDKLFAQQQIIQSSIEKLKLEAIRRDLRAVGLPTEDYIEHSAMFLQYAEKHEQAAWVAHIITPDIISGKVYRTNDFRPDPLVSTGTAVEEDYFLKFLQADSTYKYDGFGYDRGHLAPSADFRWSKQALSESYFYSNMSPQKAAFNRGAWAELESHLRAYIHQHQETQLFVITLPLLNDQLPFIKRSVNEVSIPETYLKVVLDLKNKKGIALKMPNKKISSPLSTFAISIAEAEQLSGLNFFNALPAELQQEIETTIDKKYWFPDVQAGNVEPLHPPTLPRNHFNTVQAKLYEGSDKKINVCGTVVSTRKSRSGNLWVNLDKQFPNQIFSVYVKKEHLSNFSFDPEMEWKGKVMCFKGKVREIGNSPTMRIEKEEDARYYSKEKSKL